MFVKNLVNNDILAFQILLSCILSQLHIHRFLDSCLTFQVQIADGIQYVGELANSSEGDEMSVFHRNGDSSCSSTENGLACQLEGRGPTKVDIAILDVDSSDSR